MKRYFTIFLAHLVVIGCKDNARTSKLFKHRNSEQTGITFNNLVIETDSANILTEEYIFNGGGVAIGDFNNDDQPDIFFTGNQVSNKLYLNKGNFNFKEVSKESQIEAKNHWSTGVTVVDINSDGLLDLYICAAREKPLAKRANLLFVNEGINENGIPVFKEMAEAYGIDETGNSMGATFFDYDKDGLLDLYVINNEQVHILPTNYRKKVTDGTAVSNDKLYHNNGDGTFSDVTIEAGITYEGFGLGVGISDLNYDGWPDIYVTNDYLTNDLLYINNGDGTFSNKIKKFIKHQSKFSMGIDIADFNNDNYLDIITLDMLGETNYRMKTTNMGHNYISYVLNDRWDYEYQYGRNMLQLGNGKDVPHSEIGMLAGVSRTDWSWSPLFMDVDNDGYRDLLITNGFPRDITDMDFAEYRLSVSQYLQPKKILDSIPVVKIPNYAYRNLGNLTFEDSGDNWGLDIPSFSNGAAFADLDSDGDLDYIVNNINDEAFIFENSAHSESAKNNFVRIKFKGPKTNTLGIGTKVKLNLEDNITQYYEHHLTRGYMSSVEPIAHFGLGSNTKILSIEVFWPDGKFQELKDVQSNQRINIEYSKSRTFSTLDATITKGKKDAPILKEISDSLRISYLHEEKDIVDYNLQSILPHKLSQNGPYLAKGDINGDGLEDFIVGSSSTYSPTIFFQASNGTFRSEELFSDELNRQYEEESITMFDLENDGDLDLYLVSGSNEFKNDSPFYQDRLLINDGKGKFSISQGTMPEIKSSGSVVKGQDYNNDGFTDLFIGGRTPYGQYPKSDRSYILKNENGVLKDVTENLATDLSDLGMITDAFWSDINNDDFFDLILVGEFMPITILMNQITYFQKLENTGLENYYGWWENITQGDFDNDGDIDFVVGNMGSNNFFTPTRDRPVELIAKDFDSNGSIDPILFSFFKNRKGNYQSNPVNFWGDLSKQSPLFRSKFRFYKDFAQSTKETLLTEDERKGAIQLLGNYDLSSYVENLGDGRFNIHPLPIEAQFAPINDMVVEDIDEDGNLDILAIGNDYGNETFVGRYDAFNGLLLIGRGDGKFRATSTKTSGFRALGDAKSIISIKNRKKESVYIVTQNRDSILVYSKRTQ